MGSKVLPIEEKTGIEIYLTDKNCNIIPVFETHDLEIVAIKEVVNNLYSLLEAEKAKSKLSQKAKQIIKRYVLEQ